jgi:sugar lactone lactonase YvrE
MTRTKALIRAAAVMAALASPFATQAQLVTGLRGAQGSTIGPDGALYVTEGAAGQITRINLKNGQMTAFARGLPPAILPIGGAVDIAFLGKRAYVLVALNGSDVGGSTPVGIYRVDGLDAFTVIADLGAFTQANPSSTPFFLSQGVQYALDTYYGDLIVTDGHHNRVLRVTPSGEISIMRDFDNIVPTGLAVHRGIVYMAQAGPAPHAPEDGKVLGFGPDWRSPGEVAAGAPLLVDVEFSWGGSMYALAQGTWDGAFPGSPALPNTGSLVKQNGSGEFEVVVGPLNLPTSLEIVHDDAYVVTLAGEVWKLSNVIALPFHKHIQK